MGMVSNEVGIIVRCEDPAIQFDCFIELGNEEVAELEFDPIAFTNTSSVEGFLDELNMAFCLRHGGHLHQIVKRYDHLGTYNSFCDILRKKTALFSKFNFILLTDNEEDYKRHYRWAFVDIGNKNTTTGSQYADLYNRGGKIVAEPDKTSVINEIINSYKEFATNKFSILESKIIINDSQAMSGFIKKLRAFRSVCISGNEVEIKFPYHKQISCDVNGVETIINTELVFEGITSMWKELLKHEGLYNYDEWNRKRNQYYDRHSDEIEKRRAEGISIPYDENPAESCILLNVGKYNLLDSVLRFAELCDNVIKTCEEYPHIAKRKKDGTLCVNRCVDTPMSIQYLLPPRKIPFLSAKSISGSEIRASFSLL